MKRICVAGIWKSGQFHKICREKSLQSTKFLTGSCCSICPYRPASSVQDIENCCTVTSVPNFYSGKVLHFSSMTKNAAPNGKNINNSELPCENTKGPPSLSCWNCELAVKCVAANFTEKFFCQGCDTIQPPANSLTYFEYFGIPAQYDVDLVGLRKKYKSLQFVLHPDRYGQRSEKEKAFSAEQAATVNRAYRTLLNPLSRGIYLLEINGHMIEEQETVKDDPEFLMELMELNESVMEAENEDELKRIGENNKEKLNELDGELREKFENKDWEGAKKICILMRYYISVDRNVQKKLGFA